MQWNKSFNGTNFNGINFVRECVCLWNKHAGQPSFTSFPRWWCVVLSRCVSNGICGTYRSDRPWLLVFRFLHGDDHVGSPGELWPKRKTVVQQAVRHQNYSCNGGQISSPLLTFASLLMVQHLDAEVMLWVKLEATRTEYLDGNALDSQ